jgi:hypothetical protein
MHRAGTHNQIIFSRDLNLQPAAAYIHTSMAGESLIPGVSHTSHGLQKENFRFR